MLLSLIQRFHLESAFLFTATLNVFIGGNTSSEVKRYIHPPFHSHLAPSSLPYKGWFCQHLSSGLLATEYCFFRHLIHWLKSSLISSASFCWKGKSMTHLISHFRKEGKSFQLGTWETHLFVKERSCSFSDCLLPSLCPQAHTWKLWLGILLNEINIGSSNQQAELHLGCNLTLIADLRELISYDIAPSCWLRSFHSSLPFIQIAFSISGLVVSMSQVAPDSSCVCKGYSRPGFIFLHT